MQALPPPLHSRTAWKPPLQLMPQRPAALQVAAPLPDEGGGQGLQRLPHVLGSESGTHRPLQRCVPGPHCSSCRAGAPILLPARAKQAAALLLSARAQHSTAFL